MSGWHHKKNRIFAQRLEQLMIERQLYSSDVARKTGLKRQSIDAYVQGVSQPGANAIAKIAVALEVSSDWLLGIENRNLNCTK